ncbi:uncharacterized protein [Mytilus edulis]|uniref:uncharacterized protein n=1 Tax=Mytilus edulis TaxID=6550 RepID=UPI0039EF3B7A
MDTPIKTISNTSKCCLLCGDTEKRLHCLTKHKASNEGYTRSIETTLDIKLDSSLLEFMFICEKCANACKHFNNFRGRAKQNLDNFISNHTTSRTKRMPKTPPSAMKISTADQIENSVEKLRNLNLDEKEKGARVTKKSRQQLNFNKDLNLEHAYSQHNILKHQEEDQVVLLQDHEYSIPNIMDKALETNEKIAEDFIKEACINSYNSHDGLDLDKQISSVCKLGKSVLFKSSAKDLSERNWFIDIGKEMLQHCPEFLTLLLSAIGDKITAESKLATVCTIYGMLMHCRNTRASAIQKLYTSFCIRYHTDNKVCRKAKLISCFFIYFVLFALYEL